MVVSSIQLRPYQQETVDALLAPPTGINRQLAVLATGSGKTVCFAEYLRRVLQPGRRALVLAHREELLTQAHDKIALVAPDLSVEFEQAERRADRGATPSLFSGAPRTVVVASVQTLHDARLKTWSSEAFDAVVVDEAHRSSAKSYISIFEYFGCMEGRTPLVGVTATPNRTDGVALGTVFQKIAVNYGMRELIGMGYLAPIVAHRVTSHVDLSNVSVARGEFNQAELESAVDGDDRNALIIAAYRHFALGQKAIAFCAGVKHARHLADFFRSAGIAAEAVWGAMPSDDRAAAYARFRSGETRVLCNMALLTEGYDEPEVSCVILGRPTKSALILTQAIGRGTRLSPGKSACIVIDVQDVTAGATCASVATLAGLPPKFDVQGRNVYQVAAQLETLPASKRWKAMSAEQVEQLLAEHVAGIASTTVDLFAALEPDPIVAEHSKLLWTTVGDRYFIGVDNDRYTYTLGVDTLGVWTLSRYEPSAKAEIVFGRYSGPRDAFSAADALICRAHDTRLARVNAAWRAAKPTEKQLALLASWGVQIPPNLTKGQASQIIDQRFRRSA